MRMVLNIKGKKVFDPSKNDVILYDGKEWYVTTKDEILKETKDLLNDCEKTLKALKEENTSFKKETAKQLLKMSELIEKVIK